MKDKDKDKFSIEGEADGAHSRFSSARREISAAEGKAARA